MTREDIEKLLLNWEKTYSVSLDTSQKHALLYGVVPDLLVAIDQYHKQGKLEELYQAWMLKDEIVREYLEKRMADIKADINTHEEGR